MDEKSYDKALDILLESGARQAGSRIADEIPMPDNEPDFSKRHIKKMKALFAAEKRKQRRKKAALFARAAACVALVAVFASGTAILSVDAFRVKFMNFIYEKDKPNSDIYFSDDVVNTYEDKTLSLGYIPWGFHLERYTGEKSNLFLAFFGDEKYFYVSTAPADGLINIDTENATVEKVTVNGLEGILSSSPRVTILLWHDNTLVYTVEGDIDKNEIVKIAENFKLK